MQSGMSLDSLVKIPPRSYQMLYELDTCKFAAVQSCTSILHCLLLQLYYHISFLLRYGFAENPKLELVATPKLGQREVTLSYVTDWIEKKLCEVVEVIYYNEIIFILESLLKEMVIVICCFS